MENDLFAGWTSRTQEYWVRESVSYLNNNTLCESNSWYLEALLGCILIGSNIILRIMSSRLMKFVPSFKVFGCKHGDSDIVYDCLLTIVILGRIFIVRSDEETEYNNIRIMIVVSFFLILLGYAVIFFFRPYYNSF